MNQRARTKVLFLEFNEITWTLIDPLIQQGVLPNFGRLKQQGAWASPVSHDTGGNLNPWVTWVTVHTGVESDVHGASLLEQPADTIRAKRTWEYVDEAGLSVGVYGSISSYPPRPVRGFWVPGTFAAGSETYPTTLRPVQDLNRKYTRVHNGVDGGDSMIGMAKLGIQLLRLGLKPSTIVAIAKQLVDERRSRSCGWKRVSLQPLVNYDFFEALYRRCRPDYATWHTNHVAHYMHHYWRAMDDREFLTRATDEEKARYGGAIPYGYQVADQLIGRFMQLIDDDTVLVLASSMGQQPYVADNYPAGRITVKMRDVNRILQIVGAEGVTKVDPVMASEWNVTIPDHTKRSHAKEALASAYRTSPDDPTFSIMETGQLLLISPRGMARADAVTRVHFPVTREGAPQEFPFDELFRTDDPTPKEAKHDPVGVLAFWGKKIRKGVEIADTTNVDIAPTVLSLLGVPVPRTMQGRILDEAWDAPRSSRLAAVGARISITA